MLKIPLRCVHVMEMHVFSLVKFLRADVYIQIHATSHLITRAIHINSHLNPYKIPNLEKRNLKRSMEESGRKQPKLMCQRKPKNPPSWGALVLVAHHLDPKALAMASCVSKSWSLAMSLDHVWQPLCSSHYPSLSNLKISYPSVPYHRLYAIGLAASKRRFKPPSRPRLSLDNLVFAIELSTRRAPVITIAEPGSKINNVQGNEVFKFDIDVNHDCFSGIKALEEITITWNVVLKGWEAVFTMMDCERKLSCMAAVEGWFSEELPSPGCCSSDVRSGIVGDLKVGFSADLEVEKVSVGMLRCVDWRYVSIDDGLRYLQYFLLP
ncbi:hypothetical protein CRYUN_Cryun08bG0089700 [Craigia yunnanensis]